MKFFTGLYLLAAFVWFVHLVGLFYGHRLNVFEQAVTLWASIIYLLNAAAEHEEK